MSGRLCLLAAALALASFMPASALAADDLLSPYVLELEGKGLAIGGRAMRDGTAHVDVYSEGRLTRYSFAKDLEVELVQMPLQYDEKFMQKVWCSAGRALKVLRRHLDDREAEIRAVTLVSEEGVPVYHISTYDAGGRHFGCHRVLSADGQWDGWNKAVGEEDPLGK